MKHWKYALLTGSAAFVFGATAQAASVYVDINDGNTDNAADAAADWGTFGNNGSVGSNDLWDQRTSWGRNAAGTYLEADGTVFEAFDDATIPQLVTTLSGLTPGQLYQIDVVYHSKSAGENWNVTADLAPILTDDGTVSGFTGTVLSGTTWGAADGTYRGVTVNAGTATGNTESGINEYSGLVGSIVADINGEIAVYLDDISDGSEINPGRAWADGYIVTEVPEPGSLALLGLGGLLIARRRQ